MLTSNWPSGVDRCPTVSLVLLLSKSYPSICFTVIGLFDEYGIEIFCAPCNKDRQETVKHSSKHSIRSTLSQNSNRMNIYKKVDSWRGTSENLNKSMNKLIGKHNFTLSLINKLNGRATFELLCICRELFRLIFI